MHVSMIVSCTFNSMDSSRHLDTLVQLAGKIWYAWTNSKCLVVSGASKYSLCNTCTFPSKLLSDVLVYPKCFTNRKFITVAQIEIVTKLKIR